MPSHISVQKSGKSSVQPRDFFRKFLSAAMPRVMDSETVLLLTPSALAISICAM